MAFRIRRDYGDEAAWQQGEQAYYRHLEQFSKSSNHDLWKFFYWDFFHDGEILSLDVGAHLKTVAMRLTCPNIERLHPDGPDEYLSIGFTCTFDNVTYFHIEEDPPTPHDVPDSDIVLLAAEINTSPRLETCPSDDETDRLSSILVELLAYDSRIWMEVGFSRLYVEPDEPAAFALMEASPDFHVPTWSPEKP